MIYFLRHAQSRANKEGIYAGSALDSEITDEGARDFRKVSKNNTIVFNKVFVSDLNRSIESGKIFQSEQDYPLDIVVDNRIRELDFGSLTGKPYMEFDNKEIYSRYGIESKVSFHDRINDFYNDIKREQADVLVIGHSGVAKMLHAIIAGDDIDRYNEIPQPEAYKIYEL